MRMDKVTYFPILELFGPAVVGKNKWKRHRRHRRHRPFGKCLTVSDEAFIILCYENFKLVWVKQYWQDSTAISSKGMCYFCLVKHMMLIAKQWINTYQAGRVQLSQTRYVLFLSCGTYDAYY